MNSTSAPHRLLPAPRFVTNFEGATREISPSPLRVSGANEAWLSSLAEAEPLLSIIAGGAGDVLVEIARDDVAVAPDRIEIPPASEQGYCLIVHPEPHEPAITIQATRECGARAAFMTLFQLIRQYGSTLPCVEIVDEPAFATRGVMLDISRCRVPTESHLHDVVRMLARFKINHLQLYTEHTFAYAGHDVVWQHASPMTPDEVRRLDDLCRTLGIQLAANQNCFGHLKRWLEHPPYHHLAETHGDWSFDGYPMHGPFSLYPAEPGSIELVGDMLDQLLPCFSSHLVNVGCDETFDVGQGRSADVVAKRGLPDVYFEFVHQVMDLVRDASRRPMFWADIALRHPEQVDRIPEDAVALAWGYEPDAPFDEWCEILGRAGREIWVCPGTCTWRSITGRTTERRGNLLAAAQQGRAGGATGYLVTNWGDLGHRQQWPIEAHALADGCAMAWNPDASYDDIRPAIALHVFDDLTGATATWMDTLGDVDLLIRLQAGSPDESGAPTRLRNATALFVDLDQPWDEIPAHLESMSPWQQVVEHQALQQTALDHMPVEFMTEIAITCLETTTAASRASIRRAPADVQKRTIGSLLEMMRSIREMYMQAWRARCREGGLTESVGYYDRVITELEHRQA